MYAGRIRPLADANEKIQKLCDRVKARAEEQAGKTYDVFTAKSYRDQTVNGTNYFIKVHVGGEDYIHIRVYEGLSCNEVKLITIQHSMSLQEPIVYF